jgi:hypothetical protein
MRLVKNMKKWFILLPLLLLTACGYTLVRDKGIFGGEITSVTLPVFKNRTFEPHVGSFFTDSFSRELVSSGLLQVNRPGSEASLAGTITGISVTPGSLNIEGLTIQKVATAYVSLVLSRQGKVVKAWSLADSETYLVTEVNLEEFNKRQALQRIAERMARRFHSQVLADY